MARGIIYVMTTLVTGLIKIGKTGNENFKGSGQAKFGLFLDFSDFIFYF